MNGAGTPLPRADVQQRPAAPAVLAGGTAIVLALALVKLLVHLATGWRYGYHRDEMYYVIGGRHLEWGYVDHPPFTPLLARMATTVFGESLLGLRFFSALAGAIVVVLAALLARELGGGRFARGLAALAVLASPMYLGANGMFQTVSFDQLWWVLGTLLVVRLLRTEDPRLWLPLGMVVGVGLQTKHTMALFGAALAVGLLLTPQRAWLRTRWPWLAAALAFGIVLPHLLWQVANDWPTLGFLRNSNADVQEETGRLGFVLWQALLIGPLALPIMGLGIRRLFAADGGRYRALGWLCAAVFGALLVLGGKPYYVGPLYPLLLAAGAVGVERLSRRSPRPWLRPAAGALLAVNGLLPLPILVPLLPQDTMVDLKLFDFNADLAEMVGWPEMVQQVAAVHRGLPEAERTGAAIFAGSYGEAAAIDVLGEAHDLPPAISGHNSYWLWGPGAAADARVVVAVRVRPETLSALFRDCRPAGTITNAAGVDNESLGVPIHVCREPVRPLSELWPELKRYG